MSNGRLKLLTWPAQNWRVYTSRSGSDHLFSLYIHPSLHSVANLCALPQDSDFNHSLAISLSHWCSTISGLPMHEWKEPHHWSSPTLTSACQSPCSSQGDQAKSDTFLTSWDTSMASSYTLSKICISKFSLKAARDWAPVHLLHLLAIHGPVSKGHRITGPGSHFKKATTQSLFHYCFHSLKYIYHFSYNECACLSALLRIASPAPRSILRQGLQWIFYWRNET